MLASVPVYMVDSFICVNRVDHPYLLVVVILCMICSLCDLIRNEMLWLKKIGSCSGSIFFKKKIIKIDCSARLCSYSEEGHGCE